MSLNVYKSSAGSGKTTTLVREYLKITLRNPDVFRHVLAITFTNKAANEMKERILETLKMLIDGTAWNSGEIKPLIDDLKLEKETLKEQAIKLRTLIIHRYEEFAVSTIDAFVHRIVRTFATDVKLPQNFEVVLDKDEMVPEIVSDLYQHMGTDKDLTKIMVNFVLSKIDDGKYYDPTASLSSFIEKQMDEEGFQYLRKIESLTLSDFTHYIAALKSSLDQLKKSILKQALSATDIIDKAGLEAGAFAGGKSGIAGYFAKIAVFTFDKDFPKKKTVDNNFAKDSWYSSKASADEKQSIDGIKNQLGQFYNSLQKEIKLYTFSKLLYSKIYSLALAKEIRDLLTDFTNRTQKVHISEFNKKISDEIAEQPVPFIYERLGRKYRYFLIDEFQDTSLLQWQNLLPLIEESLSNNNFNMLVGDAKQAIYRFRNGEVEQFSSLPNIYQNDGTALSMAREKMLNSHYHEKILKINYRSLTEIVNFNNEFFEVQKAGFSERLLKIYKSHEQELPQGIDKSGGYVQLDLIATETKEDFEEKRLEIIMGNIDKLLEAQFSLQDICILTRTNKSAVEIAGFLLSNNIKVVSSESLLLTNSPEIRLIIAFFKLLLHPHEKILLAEFIQQLIASGKTEGDFQELFAKALHTSGSLLGSVRPYFKEGSSMAKITGRPVYEIAEFTVRNLLQTEQVNIFLQYFLDFVFSAQEAGKETLEDFITLWEDKKEKLFISMPSGGNAIQIMTVHKAKGLKFEVVIADLYNAGNRKTKNEHWIDLSMEELPGLSVGLLPLTNSLEDIGLKTIVDEEKDKNILDFLNVIYVAFTRPVQALFAVGKHDNKDKFGAYLKQYLEKKTLWQEEKSSYSFGKLAYKGKRKDQSKGENVKLKKMISTDWEDLIRIAPSEEVYWELLDSKPVRTYGNLVHNMLSKVQYAEDVSAVVDQYRLSGLLDNLEAEHIKLLMDTVVHHPNLKRYFSSGILVKNETELLDANGKIQRPDRVVIDGDELCVIDYKTGVQSESHKKQIGAYAAAFGKLGYNRIISKLVYLNDAVEVVEV
jgi:ATP-dependent exoDNAse (exonuclease V) beta subunit